eukprot:gene24363-9976_t
MRLTSTSVHLRRPRRPLNAESHMDPSPTKLSHFRVSALSGQHVHSSHSAPSLPDVAASEEHGNERYTYSGSSSQPLCGGPNLGTSSIEHTGPSHNQLETHIPHSPSSPLLQSMRVTERTARASSPGIPMPRNLDSTPEVPHGEVTKGGLAFIPHDTHLPHSPSAFELGHYLQADIHPSSRSNVEPLAHPERPQSPTMQRPWYHTPPYVPAQASSAISLPDQRRADVDDEMDCLRGRSSAESKLQKPSSSRFSKDEPRERDISPLMLARSTSQRLSDSLGYWLEQQELFGQRASPPPFGQRANSPPLPQRGSLTRAASDGDPIGAGAADSSDPCTSTAVAFSPSARMKAADVTPHSFFIPVFSSHCPAAASSVPFCSSNANPVSAPFGNRDAHPMSVPYNNRGGNPVSLPFSSRDLKPVAAPLSHSEANPVSVPYNNRGGNPVSAPYSDRDANPVSVPFNTTVAAPDFDVDSGGLTSSSGDSEERDNNNSIDDDDMGDSGAPPRPEVHICRNCTKDFQGSVCTACRHPCGHPLFHSSEGPVKPALTSSIVDGGQADCGRTAVFHALSAPLGILPGQPAAGRGDRDGVRGVVAMKHLHALDRSASGDQAAQGGLAQTSGIGLGRAGEGYSAGTLLAYDELMLKHIDARDHPERPDRISAIWECLTAEGLVERCTHMAAREARTEELVAVHQKELVVAVQQASEQVAAKNKGEGTGNMDAISEDALDASSYIHDCYFNAHTAQCARLAAGSAADIAGESYIHDCYFNAHTAQCARLAAGSAADIAGELAAGSAADIAGESYIHDCYFNAHTAQCARLAAGSAADIAGESYIHDCYFNAHSAQCARLAAGSAAVAVARGQANNGSVIIRPPGHHDEMAVARGQAKNGAAIIRPPGHHAESGTAMGFCYFNNAAVAARAAQKEGGAKRVLIMDWDVHHGNGTQHIFYSDPSVMYISTHRWDYGYFFPGTGDVDEAGDGDGSGFNINVAWRGPGVTDADFRAAFQFVVEPIAREFAPDLVIVSAGFDAAAGDPLGGCDASPQLFGELTARLASVCPNMVLLLEGGYNLKVTARCTEQVSRVFWPEPPALPRGSQLGSYSLKVTARCTEQCVRGLLDLSSGKKELSQVQVTPVDMSAVSQQALQSILSTLEVHAPQWPTENNVANAAENKVDVAGGLSSAVGLEGNSDDGCNDYDMTMDDSHDRPSWLMDPSFDGSQGIPGLGLEDYSNKDDPLDDDAMMF